MRYYVGSDTFDYVTDFDDYPNIFKLSRQTFSEFRYQPGWILFMVICKTISSSFVLPQLITAGILNYSIFRIIRKRSNFPFIVILFYYCALVFTGLNFEFMRESLAVGIFLLGFDFIIHKKWILYYALMFLAFMIHVSAFITFIIPFFLLINLSNRRFLILVIVLFLFLTLFGKYVINQFLALLIFQDNLTSVAKGYGGSALKATHTFNYYIYNFSTYLLFPLVLIYNSVMKYGYRILFRNILLIYFLVSIMASFSAHFIRFNHYFFIFLLIEVANSFYLTFKFFKPKLLLIALFPLIFNFTNFHYLFGNYLTSGQGEDTFKRYVPYSSVLDKKMSEFRLNYYRSFPKSKRNFPEY